MNITIINGIQDTKHNKYQKTLEETVTALNKDHQVDMFTIDDMNVAYCCGCFSCWVKTPGICIYKDDGVDIVRSIAKTDYLLIVSPVVAGFISSSTKKAMDRFLPTLLPYIKIYDGESHHVPRYDKRSNLGLVLLDEGDLDDEAVKINFDIIDRLAKNFHAPKVFKACALLENIKEVITNEICSC
ncbi:MAG: flavodoxin family protein [Clostridiales bacterium]|nr:flavodoxin family protein [Clostridiales bacterium]